MQYKRALVMLAAFTLLLTGSSAGAQDKLSVDRHFRVRLTGPLSSDSTVGAKVAAQVLSPEEFAGDTLEGEVVEAHSSNLRDKESKLAFNFNLLNHMDDKPLEIRAKVTEAYNSKGVRNVDESENFKLKADNSVAGVLGNVSKLPIFGRSRTNKEKVASTAVNVAALIVSYTVKAPKIEFNTGSEFELDVTKR